MQLAGGATVTEAARLAGVSRVTATRRMADDEFRARVREERARALEQNAAALCDRSRQAVECLTSLLAAEAESVRLQAAKSILELGIRYRDAERSNRVGANAVVPVTMEQLDAMSDAELEAFNRRMAKLAGG